MMKRNEAGQTLPMMGVLLAVLIGFVAMGVDLGQGYLERRTNQNGADAASVAGEQALFAGASNTNVSSAIQNVLSANGFSTSAMVWLSASNPTPGHDAGKVYVDAQYGSYPAGGNTCTALSTGQYVKWNSGQPPSSATCVRVVLTTSKRTFFSNVPILGFAQVGAQAGSSAGDVPMNGTGLSNSINITGATFTSVSGGSSGTETFTFSSVANPPPAGTTVVVSGVTPSGYNGTYVVTSSTNTSITVSVTTGTSPGTYQNGGVITFNPGSPSPTPTPTAAQWDKGAGEGYAIWGGLRADSTLNSIGGTVMFFADSGWNSGNDVQTSCSGTCEYDATQNFKGWGDPQCFVLPLTTTCTGPNGALGNDANYIPAGTYIQIVVVKSVTHSGSENTFQRIGLVTVRVLSSCPTSPAYFRTATNPVCGTITHLDAGMMNEGGDPSTPVPTTPTPNPVIGNTN